MMKRKAIRFLLTASILLSAALLFSGCGSSKEKDPPSEVSQPEVSAPAPQVEEKVKIGVVKDTDVGLNLRKTASADADVLAIADDGSYFLLADEGVKGDWVHIRYKDTTAYVSAEYFDVREVTASEATVLMNQAPDDGSDSSEKPASSENPADAQPDDNTEPSSAASEEPKKSSTLDDGE